MMISTSNIIGKLSTHFEINSDLFNEKEKLYAICRDHIPSILEKKLSQFSLLKDWIQFDYVSIDLGEINQENWEQEFIEVLEKQLEEKLIHTIEKKLSSKIKHPSLNKSKVKADVDNTGAEIDKTRIDKHGEKTIETLFYFLKTGSLPWWQTSLSVSEFEQTIKSALNEKNAPQIFDLVNSRLSLFQRLIHHFSDSFLLTFSRLIKIPSHILKKRAALYSAFHQSNISLPEGRLREFLWESTFHTFHHLYEPDSIIGHQLITHFYQKIYTDFQTRIYTKSANFELHSELLAVLETVDVEIPIELESIQKDITKIKDVQDKKPNQIGKNQANKSGKREHEGNASKNFNNTEIDFHKIGFKKNQEPLQSDPSQGTYVNHAGLALICPFLPALFEKLQFLEKGKWKNESFSHKAVQVLAYLTKGGNYCPEYEMTLFKHLCHVPQHTCINPNLILTLSEKKEAKALLQSVIEHWPSLKNTSIDALRTSFLQRNGKLEKTETEWRLYVDRKSIDVLLDRISWGIGMIRLTWSPEVTWVYWN